MTPTLSTAVGSSKRALIFISLIVVITIVDSQFVNAFYGTNLGTPGSNHLLLYTSLVIMVSLITTILLLFVKRNDIHMTNSRLLLFRVAYIGTSIVQYAIIAILAITILEAFVLNGYNKILSLLVVYLSHFWSAVMLGFLSIIFVNWFRFSRSFSILIYAAVFGVSIFLILVTLPLLTEHFKPQPEFIYPRDYTSLITGIVVSSREIGFIYGLGNYVLPVMIISTCCSPFHYLGHIYKESARKNFGY